MKPKISIDQYLEKVAQFCDDSHGKMVRTRFSDNKGSSELAMLAAPSGAELDQLRKAVAIMTPSEKENACNLSDEEVQIIALDAGVDAANLAIFMNGYTLHCKRVS